MKIKVLGMTCAGCKETVTRALENIDKVKNKTKKDVLSTTGQLMMNLTDLEFVIRVDKDHSEWYGIDDKTPNDYEPKIKIKVEYSKNKNDQKLIHTLMGNDVSLRKDFIVSNAINVLNLDI